jgi:hypothetical protein
VRKVVHHFKEPPTAEKILHGWLARLPQSAPSRQAVLSETELATLIDLAHGSQIEIADGSKH